MGLWEWVRSHEPTDSSPWLIVGLGNPGSSYSNTRHNAGHRAVIALAVKLDAKMKPAKARALVGETKWNGHRLLLMQSMTFYNETGQAVAPLMRWYKVPITNVIVIHDDIDLPACHLKLKYGGGTAGNHGLNSLVGSLKTKDFYRVRIGAGRPSNPDQEPADFVLEKMTGAVANDFADIEERAGRAALAIVTDGLERAISSFNAR